MKTDTLQRLFIGMVLLWLGYQLIEYGVLKEKSRIHSETYDAYYADFNNPGINLEVFDIIMGEEK